MSRLLRQALLVAAVALPPFVILLGNPVPRLDADAVEYYSHLRSLYYDNDVDFENEFTHFGILNRWDKNNPTTTGLRRTNFSVGPALLWLPFYAAGDLWARFQGSVEDGYSSAHIRAVCLGSLIYGLLGLLCVYRVLRGLVSPQIAFWTVFLILYSTFLLWYMVYEPVMSHAGSFFLSALALLLWWEGRQELGPLRAAILGLVLGLATCVRWQNGLLLLLPGLAFLLEPRSRRRALTNGCVCLLGFALGVVPQLLVFKAIFGAYILPYPVQGRHYLRLDHPVVLPMLFSSRHGLLYWTPVLWGGFLGFAMLLRRDRRAAVLLAAPLLAMAYVNACSEDWWAGGSYSSRRFDSVLPHLALGLAMALSALTRWTARRPAFVLAAAGLLGCAWNLVFMEQYRRNLIPRDDTVSFARVAENGASLLSEFVGSPPAWPANWIFALRHDLSPGKYDAMVGKYLFLRQNNLGGVIDLGDDRADPALLAEGWSGRTPCEGQVCRAVQQRARLFAPLDVAEPLGLIVRASGSGTLALDLNGSRVAEFPLATTLADLGTQVPRGWWHDGLNELILTARPPGQALVDRVSFQRVPQ